MAISEIEKLERRYAENPYGLTFAPLAEMYRKSGNVARALELLGVGVEQHPAYIPARIVLGRCHLDLGDVAEAEQAFTHVLALDGENVIALKALADISERTVRFDDAERWLRTLISVDRNNDAAREQLARLEVARREAAVDAASVLPASALPAPVSVAESGEPVLEPDLEPIAVADDAPTSAETIAANAPGEELESSVAPEALAADPSDVELMPVTEVPEVAAATATTSAIAWVADLDAPVTPEAAPLVLDDLATPDEPVPPVDGFEEEPEIALDDPAVVLPGLVRPDVASLRDELADAATEEEFRIETADELVLRASSASASEFQMPDASQDLVAAKPEPDPLAGVGFAEPLTGAGVEESRSESALVPTAELALVSEPESAPVAEVVAELPADMMPPEREEATEVGQMPTLETEPVPASLAAPELEPAAPVFEPAPTDAPAREPAREVAADKSVPVEPPLIVTETMAEVLVQQGYTADALQIYRELERRNPADTRLRERRAALEGRSAQAVKGPSSYLAHETGGQSVGSFFRDLLSARLPALASATAPSPTFSHPAGAVAGAATQSGSPGAPTRPAADTLSLSAVFGDDTSPVPPAVSAASAGSKRAVSFDEFFGAPAARQPAAAPQAPAPATEDDLDQFHTWLQNLKR
jgi:tetratricopeptide (TPR) repeat protein